MMTNRLFDPYVLFLLSATIFNGGQIVLEVFHLNENGFLNNTFPTSESLQIVYIVTLGLTAMHLGAMLSVALDRPKSEPVEFLAFLDRNSRTDLSSRSGIVSSPGSAIVPYRPSTMKPSYPSQIGSTFRSSIVPANTMLAVGQIFLYVSIIPVLVTVIGAIQVAKSVVMVLFTNNKQLLELQHQRASSLILSFQGSFWS